MLIVAGHLYVDESSRRDYLTSCLEVMTPRQIGGGLSRFVLSADPIQADRINVYEIWETDEQLDAFRGADPSAGRAAWIHGVDVRRYRIASADAGQNKIILYANPGIESLYRRLGFPRMNMAMAIWCGPAAAVRSGLLAAEPGHRDRGATETAERDIDHDG